MIEFLIYFFTLYVAIKIYISTMQIGHISKEMFQKPILLTQEKYIESGKYSIYKERLSIVETLIEYALFLFWIGFGLSKFNSIFNTDSYLGTLAFLLSFIAINFLLTLPLDIYKSFVLDKRFGFSNITLKLFLVDMAKSIILFLLFGSLIILAVTWFINSFQTWWIISFIFIFSLIIFINALYPTLIAPIFNKFSSLNDDELQEKISHLLETSGFKSKGVFVMDASKRDSRLNAYFGGLGNTKRVVLFDTLLSKITQNELLAVLGHELGHFKHGDIYKNIAIMGVLIFGLFAFFGNLPGSIFLGLGLENRPSIVIALFLLLSSPLLFLFIPLIGALSRANEYKADEYGSSLTNSQDLINALIKLSDENKHFPKSHPMYIFFYYSHPPLLERLKALGYNFE